ncbi:hypothetical protein LX36DRAFT_419248 [Colletotrichum falcatum]|nr:hypothetical protein LX36DRAFT_419248 [Colletotrichum falcatum]
MGLKDEGRGATRRGISVFFGVSMCVCGWVGRVGVRYVGSRCGSMMVGGGWWVRNGVECAVQGWEPGGDGGRGGRQEGWKARGNSAQYEGFFSSAKQARCVCERVRE